VPEDYDYAITSPWCFHGTVFFDGSQRNLASGWTVPDLVDTRS
jgi:hypothetical protein